MTRKEARDIACVALERALRTTRGGSQAEEDCIADAIMAAVAEERERCAKIADEYAEHDLGVNEIAIQIAARIRSG